MNGWLAFEAVAGVRGTHPAVMMGDVVISFDHLRLLALRMAGGLRREGVGPGDRVILQLANGVAAAALPLALWALDAVPVFLSPEVGVEGIADWVGAALAVSDRPSTASGVRIRAPSEVMGEPLAQPGRGFEGSDSFGPESLGPEGFGPDHLGPERPRDGIGSIVFTSGTTGRPKGVVQRVATLLDAVDRVAAAVGFGAADRLLCAVPFSHSYGWSQLLAMYRLGLTLVLAPPGLSGLPEALERHRPTIFGGVPSVYAGLSRGVSDMARRDTGSVRVVMSTGSVMHDRVWRDLARLFPDARRCLNYGMTETIRSATLRPQDEALAPAVVGRAVPGVALCVVDAGGRVLPAGEWGEIVHRGAGIFEGYWNDPDQTERRRRPDPVTGRGFAVFTGDQGCLDAEGRLTVGDRSDRMVKVMGLTASPAAIEAVLGAVPGVEAAAVVTRPHEIMGAELVAVLVAEPGWGAVAEAAARQAAAALAPHERPRRWLLREALPLTASGKVDLVRLTAEVRQDA